MRCGQHLEGFDCGVATGYGWEVSTTLEQVMVGVGTWSSGGGETMTTHSTLMVVRFPMMGVSAGDLSLVCHSFFVLLGRVREIVCVRASARESERERVCVRARESV
jgi:hypothetical protein